MLIDTHCHLNFKTFAKDLPDVVRRAGEQGVEKLIVPGTDLESSRRAVEIAHKYPGVCYAAIGIHPHHAQDPEFIISDNVRHQLGELLSERGVVAVGEVGLDYYRYTKSKYPNSEITDEIKQKQKELLILQLDLAVIHNLPVILHCREAHDEMIQTISAFAEASADASSAYARTSADRNFSRNRSPSHDYIKRTHPPGVWHCFDGNANQLQTILTMGYYVGFDGNITYNESQYSPLVKATPLNRLLLETDSPFLTPIPHRGTRNEPAHLPLVAQAVSNYHSSPLTDVIHISTENARSLFHL